MPLKPKSAHLVAPTRHSRPNLCFSRHQTRSKQNNPKKSILEATDFCKSQSNRAYRKHLYLKKSLFVLCLTTPSPPAPPFQYEVSIQRTYIRYTYKGTTPIYIHSLSGDVSIPFQGLHGFCYVRFWLRVSVQIFDG